MELVKKYWGGGGGGGAEAERGGSGCFEPCARGGLYNSQLPLGVGLPYFIT